MQSPLRLSPIGLLGDLDFRNPAHDKAWNFYCTPQYFDGYRKIFLIVTVCRPYSLTESSKSVYWFYVYRPYWIQFQFRAQQQLAVGLAVSPKKLVST